MMRWIGLVFLTVAAAAVGVRLLIARRASGAGLGSLSDRWIAEHRSESL